MALDSTVLKTRSEYTALRETVGPPNLMLQPSSPSVLLCASGASGGCFEGIFLVGGKDEVQRPPPISSPRRFRCWLAVNRPELLARTTSSEMAIFASSSKNSDPRGSVRRSSRRELVTLINHSGILKS